jgi:lantibiotic modifying enzyme
MWRSRFVDGGGDSDFWAQFLAHNNMSEDGLAALLYVRVPNDMVRPMWIDCFESALDFVQNGTFHPASGRTIAENLASPLITFAWRRLRKRLKLQNTEVFSPRAASAIRRSLLRRLILSGRGAIEWEVCVAFSDVTWAATIQDQRALQKHFFSRGIGEELSKLLINYPVLARMWCIQILFWMKFIEDFARHALSFAQVDSRRSEDRYLINNVLPDLSDPHAGGRTVMKVLFGDGTEWFYKPRSGQQELTWYALLERLNKAGFIAPFHTLGVRCCGDHCWMESVIFDSPQNQAMHAERSFRTGAIMYLVHLLRGVDFHAENILGVGDQSVVIDCETLLHPAEFLPNCKAKEDDSIMRTGFLPNALQSALEEQQMEGAKDGLSGVLEIPRQCVDDILRGFAAMHRFLVSKPKRITDIDTAVSELIGRPSRRIYRPSLYYYRILQRSLKTSLLRIGLDRSIFLWSSFPNLNGAPLLAEKEVGALENGDLPFFYGRSLDFEMDLTDATYKRSVSVIKEALA